VVKVEPDLIAGDRVKMEMANLTKEIPRRRVEMLAFPLVHVRPNGVTIRPLEARINIEQRLYVIVPGGKLAHRLHRIAKGQRVQHSGLSWLQVLYVHGNHLCSRAP